MRRKKRKVVLMRVAVLSAAESWYFKDLKRAAGDAHTVRCFSFRRLATRCGSAIEVLAEGESLTDFDAVLVRSMPPGSLEQVVFRMDLLGRLEAAGIPVCNAPRALEVAIDKYLATERLREAGLEVPQTCVCQTAAAAMEAFDQLGGRVVIKPLFGGEGRGITALDDPALADRAFRMLEQMGAVIYLQEFVEHAGCDLRLLVLGDEVFGIRRSNPHDWRTNVSRGAKTEAIEVTDSLREHAQRASAAIGADIAGVDLLPARDGRLLALEVNAVPGWRALAHTLEIDIAERVLEFLSAQVAERRSVCMANR